MASYAARSSERWSALGDALTVDMSEEMMRLTLAIVGKTLFDADVEGEAQEIGQSLTEALHGLSRTLLPGGEMVEKLPLPANQRAEEARQRRNLATTLRRTAIDAYLEAADKVTPSRLDELESASLAGARNFEALCGDLVPGKDQAYSIYRILSMEAHPTLLVADQWFAPAREGSTARATLLVRPHELESPWTPVVASSLVWAGRAFDYFDGSHARRSLLRSTARALGIPEELKESPESQKRRAEADRQRRKAKQAAASGSNSERPS